MVIRGPKRTAPGWWELAPRNWRLLINFPGAYAAQNRPMRKAKRPLKRT